MYIIQNLTNKTIMIPDIRVEIGPRKIMDLEKVIERSSIDKSVDLKNAISSRHLALTRFSTISAPISVRKESKIVEKSPEPQNNLSEEKLNSIIRKAISDEIKQRQDTNISDTVKNAIHSSVGELMSSIRSQINTVNVPQVENSISAEKLAEISQKNVEKISQNIESSDQKIKPKVSIINKGNLNNLANEL